MIKDQARSKSSVKKNIALAYLKYFTVSVCFAEY